MLESLAVVILSYNKKDRTSRAVQDTLAQTQIWRQPTFLVLVHNGSLEKNVSDLRAEFPNIEHLVLPDNKGYSGGMNAGLAFVFRRSAWAMAVSNDCVLLNEPGENLFLRPALIAPVVYRRKSGQVESCGGFCNWSSAQLRHARTPQEFAATPAARRYIPGSCYLIHRSLFEKTQGFNELLHTYWEDVDLSFRAHRLNFPLLIGDAWHVRHDIGRTCHGQSLYTLYFFQRNRLAIMHRYAPWFLKPWIAVRLSVDFFRLYRRLKGARADDRRHLFQALRHGFRLPRQSSGPTSERAQTYS